MLNTNNTVLGNRTQSRTAFALIAATLLIGGSDTEASAKSRHHHSHHAAKSPGSDWRDSQASVGSTGGPSFPGMASFFGNESGKKTPSGGRFNPKALTAAHPPLP